MQNILKISKLTAFLFFFLVASQVCADTNVGGNINTHSTWTLANSPYIVVSDINLGATLTIEAGVVVKVNSGKSINVGYFANQQVHNGRLISVGTSSSKIQFIGNAASPGQGYWGGIKLHSPYAVPPSRLVFVTIKHAIVGLRIASTGEIVHHSTFENNRSGIEFAWGNYIPEHYIYQNTFINNGTGNINWGANNLSTIAKHNVRFCWWNSSTGPTTSGGGTAQRVSANIYYEPYLIAGASDVHYFTEGAVIHRTFNPTIGIHFQLQFQTNQSGNWSVSFLNDSDQIVRTFTGSGSNAAVIWDGTDDQSVLVPNGNYTYKIESGVGSDFATPARGSVVLDNNRQLAITSISASPVLTGGGSTLTAIANFDDPTWTMRVKDSAGLVVNTKTGTDSPALVGWGGDNEAFVPVPDGFYTLEIEFVLEQFAVTSSVVVEVDHTHPTAIFISPTNNQLLSNALNDGSYEFPIVITATDSHFSSWVLKKRRVIPCCTTQFTAASGSTERINNAVYTFQTFGLANGERHEFVLTVTDTVGRTENTTIFVDVGNVNVTRTPIDFNPSQGGSVSYTTVVPLALTQTIYIKNLAGQTVRTLLENGQRNSAGNYIDIWDGRDDSGALVPDGPYFYATRTDTGGIVSMIEYSNLIPDSNHTNHPLILSSPNDPFIGKPLKVTYTLPQAGRVTIGFGANSLVGCNSPDFCLMNNEYQESGQHTFTWAGVDTSGIWRPDALRVVVVSFTPAVGSVVVYGTRPQISDFTLAPHVYNPFQGNQNLILNLATYANQQVEVTASFKNQQSASVLRTIAWEGVSPGLLNLSWDGHAENGMWVSPGIYIVTITVQDSTGNSASAELLTTVKY